MAKGIFIIDASGQVTWTDWTSDSSTEPPLKIKQGRMVTVRPNDQRLLDGALEGALASAADKPEPLTVIIEGTGGKQRHIIYIVPIRRAGLNSARQTARDVGRDVESDAPAVPPQGAMVFVVDPSHCVAASPDLLQREFGLSPSESRVASLVAASGRPRDVAAKLGLTEESTRVILKRVFAKVGVSRQSELVALVSNLTTMPMR
jgi:DNA-binding CsgD family transcriptional regulator